LIHMACVWPILLTFQQMLAYTPSFGEFPLFGGIVGAAEDRLDLEDVGGVDDRVPWPEMI